MNDAASLIAGIALYIAPMIGFLAHIIWAVKDGADNMALAITGVLFPPLGAFNGFLYIAERIIA